MVANLELALPLYSESIRIYRAINYDDDANKVALEVIKVEEAVATAPTQG